MVKSPSKRITRLRRARRLRVVAITAVSVLFAIGYGLSFWWAVAVTWNGKNGVAVCYGGVDLIERTGQPRRTQLAVERLDYWLPYWWCPMPEYYADGSRSLFLPMWPVLVTMLIVTAVVLRRHLKRPRGNVCAQCGYDLRGNVSGRCPECGTPVADAQCGFSGRP